MSVRQPLLGLTLGLLLVACSGSTEDEPHLPADDAGADAPTNEDAGARSDADVDADSDADTDPDAL